MKGKRAGIVLSVLGLLAVERAAWAQVELKNDGFTDGASVAFQMGFASGEIGASRFVPTGGTSYQVTNVRFLLGGSGSGVERTITLHVWDDSAGSSNPGAELFTSDYTILAADDVLLDIDLSAEGITVTGQFRIGIEFNHTGLPSIARDDDGNITPNRNFIYAVSPIAGWYESSALGLTGDWIIRAFVQPLGGPTPDAGTVVTPDAAPPGTPDAAPPGTPDAAPSGMECAVNSDCLNGNYCDEQGMCTYDCRLPIDCPSGETCNGVGQCVAAESDGGGCGCRIGGRAAASGLAALALALALIVRLARRRMK